MCGNLIFGVLGFTCPCSLSHLCSPPAPQVPLHVTFTCVDPHPPSPSHVTCTAYTPPPSPSSHTPAPHTPLFYSLLCPAPPMPNTRRLLSRFGPWLRVDPRALRGVRQQLSKKAGLYEWAGLPPGGSKPICIYLGKAGRGVGVGTLDGLRGAGCRSLAWWPTYRVGQKVKSRKGENT